MAMSEALVRKIVKEAIEANNASVETQVGLILAGVKAELANEINAQVIAANKLPDQLKIQSDRVTLKCDEAHERVSNLVAQFNQNNEGIRTEFGTLRTQLGEKFAEIETAHERLKEQLAAFDSQVDEKSARQLLASCSRHMSV